MEKEIEKTYILAGDDFDGIEHTTIIAAKSPKEAIEKFQKELPGLEWQTLNFVR